MSAADDAYVAAFEEDERMARDRQAYDDRQADAEWEHYMAESLTELERLADEDRKEKHS